MGRYYTRVPTRIPQIRVLAKSQLADNKWAWIIPGEKSEYIPVLRTEDGPYMTVKF